MKNFVEFILAPFKSFDSTNKDIINHTHNTIMMQARLIASLYTFISKNYNT